MGIRLLAQKITRLIGDGAPVWHALRPEEQAIWIDMVAYMEGNLG